MNCTQCEHPEEDHGPVSGRWSNGDIIPGRLCYHEENQGYSQDLCPCSGFNQDPSDESNLEVLFKKAGV